MQLTAYLTVLADEIQLLLIIVNLILSIALSFACSHSSCFVSFLAVGRDRSST